jgi:hypothetical protein
LLAVPGGTAVHRKKCAGAIAGLAHHRLLSGQARLGLRHRQEFAAPGEARELWIQPLGLPTVVPPPEEEKEVKTAIGAARAKQAQEAHVARASDEDQGSHVPGNPFPPGRTGVPWRALVRRVNGAVASVGSRGSSARKSSLLVG